MNCKCLGEHKPSTHSVNLFKSGQTKIIHQKAEINGIWDISYSKKQSSVASNLIIKCREKSSKIFLSKRT